jgi:hypothetical protein
VRLPVFCEPEVPDQPPGDIEQEVAFVLDQEIVAEVLYPMLHDEPEPSQRMFTVGALAALTITVKLLKSLPPEPTQFRLYTLVAVRLLVDCEPDVDFAPDQSPLAVHPVAFVVVHESVAAVSYGILHEPDDPLQRKVRLGAAGAATVTVARASAAGAVLRSTITLPVYVPALP